jgi:opacity protein-like surface antigen
MRLRFAAAMLLMAPGGLHAGGLEGTLQLGQAFPFYEQSFSYDPGRLSSPFPGATVEQSGIFTLNARGGLALGGSLAYYFGSHVGLELRLDTADVRVRTEGASYRVRADLPSPLPDFDTEVDLGQGTVDLERLRPFSLGVVVRSGGARRRVFVSAGASYLPGFRFEVEQAVGVAAPRLIAGRLDVARVTLGAEALPSEEGEGRLGLNAGTGVQFDLGPRAAITVEGRYFHFQRQTLTWGAPRGVAALPRLEEAIVREIGEELGPVQFSPRFFHAAAGVSFRF